MQLGLGFWEDARKRGQMGVESHFFFLAFVGKKPPHGFPALSFCS